MHKTIIFGSVQRVLPSIYCVATCALLVVLLVTAGHVSAAPALADPPARVGRIGFVEGDVSFFADRAEGWGKARLNFPVTSKNSIWINGTGRAEVRIGASAFRIDADSILDFTRIDDDRMHVFLQRGTLNVRLRAYPAGADRSEAERGTVTVETNAGSILLQSDGRYRIDAAQAHQETRLSVLAGLARFDNRGAVLNIEAGQSLTIRHTNGAASFVFDRADAAPFDLWAEARDSRWDDIHRRYANERRVSPRMTGYEDLDSYGDWTEDREYGLLWSPRAVVTGWAPYRYGSWAYVRPWGWTWVDEAAWGFAPFHYGRWLHRQARWYWWPGAYHHRPVFAPALVGWTGNANWHVSISLGGGTIGWFPLAPHENYVPHYTHNQTYIRQINNITNINNVTIINPPARFANQNQGGTVVGSGVMVSGEPVWRTATIQGPGGRMTKPVVDPHDGSRVTATHVPPNFAPAPARPQAATTKPAPAVDTQGTAVSGEAVRPQPTQWRTTAAQQGTSVTPTFAKPTKPNPVAAQPTGSITAPATRIQGEAPGSPARDATRDAPAARAHKPAVLQTERGTEQRVDGPVQLKERGEQGERGGHQQKNPDRAPATTKPRTAKPQEGGGETSNKTVPQ